MPGESCVKPGTGSDSHRLRVALEKEASGAFKLNPRYPADESNKHFRDRSLAVPSMLADACEAAKLAVAQAVFPDDLDDHAVCVVASLSVNGGAPLLWYAYGQNSISSFAAIRAVAEAKLKLAATPGFGSVSGVQSAKSATGYVVGLICAVVGDSSKHPGLYPPLGGNSIHSAATSAAAIAFRKSRNDPNPSLP